MEYVHMKGKTKWWTRGSRLNVRQNPLLLLMIVTLWFRNIILKTFARPIFIYTLWYPSFLEGFNSFIPPLSGSCAFHSVSKSFCTNNKLLTRDNLIKIKPINGRSRHFCYENESIHHIFLTVVLLLASETLLLNYTLYSTWYWFWISSSSVSLWQKGPHKRMWLL